MGVRGAVFAASFPRLSLFRRSPLVDTPAQPQLDDLQQRALAARAIGEPYVFVELSRAGRLWAHTVDAHGMRGIVVRRTHDALVVRFGVIDVLLAAKRAYLRANNTAPQAPRFRRASRHVTIR
jgi:ribosomal protein L35AE/L33A